MEYVEESEKDDRRKSSCLLKSIYIIHTIRPEANQTKTAK